MMRKSQSIANVFGVAFAVTLLGLIAYMLHATLYVAPASIASDGKHAAAAENRKVYLPVSAEDLPLAKIPWLPRAAEPTPANVKTAEVPWVTQKPQIANITVGLAR